MLLNRHHLARGRAARKRHAIHLRDQPLVRPGQISFSPGLGRLRITAVEQIPSLDALTDADARDDGFASREELLAELHRLYAPPPSRPAHKHYPRRAKTRRIFRIHFPGPLPDHLPAAKSPGTPPRAPARKPRKVRPRPKPEAQAAASAITNPIKPAHRAKDSLLSPNQRNAPRELIPTRKHHRA